MKFVVIKCYRLKKPHVINLDMVVGVLATDAPNIFTIMFVNGESLDIDEENCDKMFKLCMSYKN